MLASLSHASPRLRIDTPWDWQQRYRLRRLTLFPTSAGQPQVVWTAECTERATGHTRVVVGRSRGDPLEHGRFAKTPEAKVY